MEPLAGITSGSVPAADSAGATDATGRVPTEQAQASAVSATATGIRLPEDRVNLSGRQPTRDGSPDGTQPAGARSSSPQAVSTQQKPGEQTTADGASLDDPQVQAQIAHLKQTEEKVKAHEAAHKSAGGSLASSASYSYTRGPDGRSYITGGEVQINMSDGQTPQETISRMQQVIRAALAPADPSGQDRAVAAQAASRMSQAQQEKLQAESPTARSDPGRPIDPAEEASRLAASPDITENTTAGFSSAAPDKSDFSRQIRQAYSSTAAQGVKPTSTGQTTGSSFTTGSAPFSALA